MTTDTIKIFKFHENSFRLYIIEPNEDVYYEIYQQLGNFDSTLSFRLKPNSYSYNTYGSYIDARIYFTQKDRYHFNLGQKKTSEKIKITVVNYIFNKLNSSEIGDLRYGGLDIKDIDYIEFDQLSERNQSKIKKIGNRIPVDLTEHNTNSNIDISIYNYYVMKYNRGEKLHSFERSEFIGKHIALNGDSISDELARSFNIDPEKVMNEIDIAYSYYTTKCRNGKALDYEKKNLNNLKSLILNRDLTILESEIKKSKIRKSLPSDYPIIELVDLVEKFRPSVLLNGDFEVFWDLESYLHIVLRHIQRYQIGKFKNKDKIPYDLTELKWLIENILYSLREEIFDHFKKRPNSNFSKHGSDSIDYNGDYFTIKIDPNGKLIQFHSMTYKNKKK